MSRFENPLSSYTRRDFLKLSGTGLLSLCLLPAQKRFRDFFAKGPSDSAENTSLGRVTAREIILYEAPTTQSRMLGVLKKDTVINITRVVSGESEPVYNQIWYEIDSEGFAHSGTIQPVQNILNTPVQDVLSSGSLAEVSVPFTDARWHPDNPYSVPYRLYHGCTFWVIKTSIASNGTYWYKIHDDEGYNYYADASHLRILSSEELSTLSPDTPAELKRLEVHLADQVVIAYEDDQAVFMTRAATGAKFSTGNFATPRGSFITNRKRPSRHMVDNLGSSYDLPGVPWVSYLTEKGVAFHGTFWHNDFGNPRSHGCINLSNQAARWIYRWTTPKVPFEQNYWAEMEGTSVEVL